MAAMQLATLRRPGEGLHLIVNVDRRCGGGCLGFSTNSNPPNIRSNGSRDGKACSEMFDSAVWFNANVSTLRLYVFQDGVIVMSRQTQSSYPCRLAVHVQINAQGILEANVDSQHLWTASRQVADPLRVHSWLSCPSASFRQIRLSDILRSSSVRFSP